MKFRNIMIGVLFDVYNGATPKSTEAEYWDGDIPWVGPSDFGKISGRYISQGERSITQEGYESCGTRIVPAGSIIVSIRAPIGHMAIAQQAMCFNQGCRGLVPRELICSEFAYWALHAHRPFLEAAGQGTTFLELSRNKLRSEKIPVPSLDEQKRICDFLDREVAEIDRVIGRVGGLPSAKLAAPNSFLGYLMEKRFALIRASVTGRLDTSSLEVSAGKPHRNVKRGARA